MYKTTKSLDPDVDLKIRRFVSPQAVSVTKNPDDQTREQIINRQEKFLKLPEEIKDKLVSPETSKIIQAIGIFFSLELIQLADIARTIRSYYFGEIRLEDFPNILAREIPTDINTAQKISEQIIQRIIRDETLGINKNLVDLSLFQAIQQYSRLGEQLITSAPIRLKIFPQPVRPSIKNWIEDYRGAMGAQKHGIMERGNYLFHSDNTKNLVSGDRKKLAEVLRSLDEDVALKVDPDRQEVVFEQTEENSMNHESRIMNQAIEKNNQNQNHNSQFMIRNSDNVRFSSPQTLPSEKPNTVNYQPIANQNNVGKPWIPQEEKKDPTIRGNVVDLKN